MIAQDDPIRSKILTALQSGRKTAGDLLTFTGCNSYPVLNGHLQALQKAGEITTSFDNGYLEYLLSPKSEGTAKPFFLGFTSEQPITRFLWNNPKQ